MRRKIASVVSACMLLALTFPLLGVAQPPPPSPFGQPDGPLPVATRDPEGQTPRVARPQANGTARVVIELADQPTTVVYASIRDAANQEDAASVTRATRNATQAAVAQLSRVESQQQRVLPALARLNATVLYRTQRVYNGIAVQSDVAALAQIAQLPGVKALHPLTSVTLLNASSVPFIGAPELWSSAAGLTGKDIKVGIIDSGIDYIHTDFGGSGLSLTYSSNDTTVVGDVAFPTAKVAGGYDFVGDNYDSISDDPAKNTPQPDPDPMDCDGHGTHVAGTAAGYGVNADGTTYAGPYTDTIDFDQFKIGPGVAPQASLYALRVFGCEGSASSDVVSLAIEYSVDPNGDGDFADRLDVINMSLGASGGGNLDTQSIASDNAAKAGVVVVASAGNSGDAYYIGGSPGNADRAISVAASADGGLTFLGVNVNSPEVISGTYEAAGAAFGPPLATNEVTATVVYAAPADGCVPLTNGAAISGTIALIDRGTCAFVDKVQNAQDAGALAVVIVNNRPGSPATLGGSSDTIEIPSVMIGQDDGATIKAQLAGGMPVEMTLSTRITFPRPDLGDTLADFSSRGPGHAGSHLKPDITAPGLSIFSASNGDGSEGATLSGTSMAAPHIAGSMALLKQQHPTWTVEELKALAMNTAINDVRSGPAADALAYGPGRVGAGRVDLPNAAAQSVIAYNGDGSGTVSLSFGALEITTTTTLVKPITVVNKGTGTATYNLAYQPVVTIPGVSYSIAPAQVTLLPSQSIPVQVTMTADPSQMLHTHDPSVSETQNGVPRHWLSEAAGYMTMTASGAQAATGRLPIYAAARPASQMQAVQRALPFTDPVTATGAIDLAGLGVVSATSVPTGELSIVTAYELAYVSPQSTGTIAGRNADLRYVGVASDFKATGAVSETMLFFGLSTFRDWASPHQVAFEVLIDADQDGSDDYSVIEWNLGDASGFPTSDVFVTAVVSPTTGEQVSDNLQFLNGLPAAPLDAQTPGLNTVPFNTNVMMLPVAAADIGLSDANSVFNYRIRTYSTDLSDAEFQDDLVLYGNPVEETPYLTYDAARPGLDVANRELLNAPAYPDLPDTAIPFAYDKAAFMAANSRGLLLFHHHNTDGNRVDVVDRAQLALPLIAK